MTICIARALHALSLVCPILHQLLWQICTHCCFAALLKLWAEKMVRSCCNACADNRASPVPQVPHPRLHEFPTRYFRHLHIADLFADLVAGSVAALNMAVNVLIIQYPHYSVCLHSFCCACLSMSTQCPEFAPQHLPSTICRTDGNRYQVGP